MAALTEQIKGVASAEAARNRLIQLMADHGIIGRSAAIIETFESAIRFSEISDLPVLITGASGTGKELIARCIARMDPFHKNGTFVPVNCAAVPATMPESEVFGHRRGAFTVQIENGKDGLKRLITAFFFKLQRTVLETGWGKIQNHLGCFCG